LVVGHWSLVIGHWSLVIGHYGKLDLKLTVFFNLLFFAKNFTHFAINND